MIFCLECGGGQQGFILSDVGADVEEGWNWKLHWKILQRKTGNI